MLGMPWSVEAPMASLMLFIAIAGGMMGVVPGTEPADDPPKQVEVKGGSSPMRRLCGLDRRAQSLAAVVQDPADLGPAR